MLIIPFIAAVNKMLIVCLLVFCGPISPAQLNCLSVLVTLTSCSSNDVVFLAL